LAPMPSASVGHDDYSENRRSFRNCRAPKRMSRTRTVQRINTVLIAGKRSFTESRPPPKFAQAQRGGLLSGCIPAAMFVAGFEIQTWERSSASIFPRRAHGGRRHPLSNFEKCFRMTLIKIAYVVFEKSSLMAV